MSLEIKLEDIPENVRDIAEAIGMEAFIKLAKLCGGQTGIYIPKYSNILKGARDREIKRRYTRYNLEQLAREYNLSTQQIREIALKEKPKNKKQQQRRGRR